MNRNAIKIISIIISVLGLGSTLAAYADKLPEEYKWIGLIVVTAAMGLKDILVVVCDILDDGQKNNSFKP